MKKLVALTLVLGIASLATAGIANITGYSGEVLNPGQTLTLGISGSTDVAETMNVMLAVNPVQGTVDGGETLQGGLSLMFPYYYMPTFLEAAGLDTNFSAVAGVIADLGALSGDLVGGVIFECAGAGNAVVSLYTSVDTVTWALAEQITISQIPEPATMVLLGLGALVLRRKK